VDFEIADLKHGASGTAASTKNGANSCGKFRKGEGPGQIIVGTCIEQADTLFRKIRRRDHQDGQVRLLRANVAQKFEAGLCRKIEIQYDEIVRLVRSQTLGFPAVRDHLHGKLFLLQPLMEKFRQRCVMLSDKNAHWHTPNSKFERG
jgi:hypothetical protein